MKTQDTPSRKLDQYIVRFPDGMRDRLKAEAELRKRSLNAEIVSRLDKSLGRGSRPTIAIRTTDVFGNKGFVKLRDGRVSHVGADGTAWAMSNFFRDRAVEFELAAEDAETAEELLAIANAHFKAGTSKQRVDLIEVARAREVVLR